MKSCGYSVDGAGWAFAAELDACGVERSAYDRAVAATKRHVALAEQCEIAAWQWAAFVDASRLAPRSPSNAPVVDAARTRVRAAARAAARCRAAADFGWKAAKFAARAADQYAAAANERYAAAMHAAAADLLDVADWDCEDAAIERRAAADGLTWHADVHDPRGPSR